MVECWLWNRRHRALALQLGHRTLVDLNFITEKDEPHDESRAEIVSAMAGLNPNVVSDHLGSLAFYVSGISTGFFGYGYPLIGQAGEFYLGNPPISRATRGSQVTGQFEYQQFDSKSYVERITTGPCFICEMVTHSSASDHVIYQDERAIVFLNKYPTLYGYTLVAPCAHREQVTGDFRIQEYLDLQRLIYTVAEAVRAETHAERVYILSLGSQQANSHVHWHIAPLPPGVPFEKQQLAALRFSSGVLKIPEDELTELTLHLRERIERSMQRAD